MDPLFLCIVSFSTFSNLSVLQPQTREDVLDIFDANDRSDASTEINWNFNESDPKIKAEQSLLG